MRIIEINKLPNGAHKNQTSSGSMIVSKGWAIIPDEMICDNFPFGDVKVEEVDGVMVVTEWVPGVMPEPENPELTQLDIIEAQVTYTAMMTNTLLEV